MTQPTLPSVVAAEKFWRKDPDAYSAILKSMAQRAAIAGTGLFIAGERKNLLKYTLAVTIAIELVVLWEVKKQMPKG